MRRINVTKIKELKVIFMLNSVTHRKFQSHRHRIQIILHKFQYHIAIESKLFITNFNIVYHFSFMCTDERFKQSKKGKTHQDNSLLQILRTRNHIELLVSNSCYSSCIHRQFFYIIDPPKKKFKVFF